MFKFDIFWKAVSNIFFKWFTSRKTKRRFRFAKMELFLSTWRAFRRAYCNTSRPNSKIWIRLRHSRRFKVCWTLPYAKPVRASLPCSRTTFWMNKGSRFKFVGLLWPDSKKMSWNCGPRPVPRFIRLALSKLGMGSLNRFIVQNSIACICIPNIAIVVNDDKTGNAFHLKLIAEGIWKSILRQCGPRHLGSVGIKIFERCIERHKHNDEIGLLVLPLGQFWSKSLARATPTCRKVESHPRLFHQTIRRHILIVLQKSRSKEIEDGHLIRAQIDFPKRPT